MQGTGPKMELVIGLLLRIVEFAQNTIKIKHIEMKHVDL
jgi:hypothetical protein